MKAVRLTVLATIAFGSALYSAGYLIAQPPPGQKQPAKGRTLDQQLLDDLDRQLLEGLPGSKRPATPPQPGPEEQRAGPPALPDAQNPLAQIARQMRTVESRIAQRDTSAETQGMQEQILKDLSALLEQARQQAASRQPGQGAGRGQAQAGVGTGQPTPGPPRDSTQRIERGTKEATQTADVKDLLRRIWGHLPDKLRDEMQAALSEQFLPKYERLIEEYYQRLAEEQPGGP